MLGKYNSGFPCLSVNSKQPVKSNRALTNDWSWRDAAGVVKNSEAWIETEFDWSNCEDLVGVEILAKKTQKLSRFINKVWHFCHEYEKSELDKNLKF